MTLVVQPDALAKKSISPLVKVLIALGILLGATGAADEAGYTPDMAALKDLGLGGAIALMIYLELRVMPVAQRIAARDRWEQENAKVPIVVPPPATDTSDSRPRAAATVALVRDSPP